MSTNQHDRGRDDRLLDQNDRMPGDPGDGGSTAADKRSAKDRQDESAIEAFDEEGAGIAAKE